VNVSNLFISSTSQIAPATAFKILSDTTLAAPSANLDSGAFISTGYTYLKVIALWDAISANSVINMRLNNDSNDLYGWMYFSNYANTASLSDTSKIVCSERAITRDGMLSADIQNILASQKQISGRVTRGHASGGTEVTDEDSFFSGLYSTTTSTITRVNVYVSAATFPAGSRIIIMGV